MKNEEREPGDHSCLAAHLVPALRPATSRRPTGWIHGCVGLHTWLRLRPWWPKAAGFVYPLVFLVPILALPGFVEAGKGALALLNGGDQDWAQANADATVRFGAISPRLLLIQDIFLAVYAAPVVSAIAPFIARARRQRWHGRGRHG